VEQFRKLTSFLLIIGLSACTNAPKRQTASEARPSDISTDNLTTITNAAAAEDQDSDSVIDKITKAECPNCNVPTPQCTKENTTNVTKNFQCITLKGGVFRRIHHKTFGWSWLTANGAIWSDILVDDKGNHDFTQDQGKEMCQKLGGKLPSKDDFRAADNLGFLEVFSDFGPGGTHWTSNMDTNSNYFAIAVSSATELGGYGDAIYGGLRFFKEQKKILFLDVTFKIICIDQLSK
jgi:hypothetical protein